MVPRAKLLLHCIPQHWDRHPSEEDSQDVCPSPRRPNEPWNARCDKHEDFGEDAILHCQLLSAGRLGCRRKTAVGRWLLALEKRNLLAAARSMIAGEHAEVLEAFRMNPEILDEDDEDDALEMDSEAV